jgi:hypothetical protein
MTFHAIAMMVGRNTQLQILSELALTPKLAETSTIAPCHWVKTVEESTPGASGAEGVPTSLSTITIVSAVLGIR